MIALSFLVKYYLLPQQHEFAGSFWKLSTKVKRNTYLTGWGTSIIPLIWSPFDRFSPGEKTL